MKKVIATIELEIETTDEVITTDLVQETSDWGRCNVLQILDYSEVPSK